MSKFDSMLLGDDWIHITVKTNNNKFTFSLEYWDVVERMMTYEHPVHGEGTFIYDTVELSGMVQKVSVKNDEVKVGSYVRLSGVNYKELLQHFNDNRPILVLDKHDRLIVM